MCDTPLYNKASHKALLCGLLQNAKVRASGQRTLRLADSGGFGFGWVALRDNLVNCSFRRSLWSFVSVFGPDFVNYIIIGIVSLTAAALDMSYVGNLYR